jgi:hypothetical protein
MQTFLHRIWQSRSYIALLLPGKPGSRLIAALIVAVALDTNSLGATPPQAPEPQSPVGNFELLKVAEGVYAAIRKEPPGLMFDANSVFIINDDDVIVVDTNITASSAKEVLAAIRKLTNKPVKYVVQHSLAPRSHLRKSGLSRCLPPSRVHRPGNNP